MTRFHYGLRHMAYVLMIEIYTDYRLQALLDVIIQQFISRVGFG